MESGKKDRGLAFTVEKTYCFRDNSGSLYPVEFKDLPFEPKRIFFVTSNGVVDRGGHAHHKTEQLVFCIKGEVLVKIDDGEQRAQYKLREGEMTHIPVMTWDSQIFLSGHDILAVFASTNYDKKDYIEDYDEFLKIAAKKRQG